MSSPVSAVPNSASILAQQSAVAPELPENQPGGQQAGVTTWVDSLPDAFKTNEAITSYGSFDELLNSHAQIKSAYKPAPTTPEEYGLSVPEGLPEGVNLTQERLDKYASKALELGIPKEALPELFKLHMDELGLDVQAYQEQQTAVQTQRDTDLQTLWGDNFAKNAESVQHFLKTFATPEEQSFIQENAALLNHPQLLNLLAKAGQAAAPATQIGASSTTNGPSFAGSPQQQATAKITSLMGDKSFLASLKDPLNPQHKSNVAYWNRLHHDEQGIKFVE